MREQMNVVMLATKKASNIVLEKIPNTLGLASEDSFIVPSTEIYRWGNQHLYITDDSEIKEVGVYVFNRGSGSILFIEEVNEDSYQAIVIIKQGDKSYHPFIGEVIKLYKSPNLEKIIATTNPELWYKEVEYKDGTGKVGMPSGIAKLSPDFIQAYIREYNTGKPIVSVMVEVAAPCDANPNFLTPSNGTMDCSFCKREGMDFGDCHSTCNIPKLRPDGTIITHPIVEQMFTKEDMEAAYHYGRMNDKLNIPKWEKWLSETYPNK